MSGWLADKCADQKITCVWKCACVWSWLSGALACLWLPCFVFCEMTEKEREREKLQLQY
jgi:hypothetical protein